MKRVLGVFLFLVPALAAGASGTTLRVTPTKATSPEQQALAGAFEAAVKQSGKDIRLPSGPSEKPQVEIRVMDVVRHGNTDEVDCDARQGNQTMPLHLSYDITKRDAFLNEFVQKSLPRLLADLAAKGSTPK